MAFTTRRKATVAGIGVTGAAALLALTLAGPNFAFADPSASPSGSAAASPAAPGKPGGVDKRAEQQDKLATDLAKELGIDKAKVAAALTKVQAQEQADATAQRAADLKTKLDQAVKDGKLTQAEEDAIIKASANGVLPGGGPGGFGGGRGPGHK